MKRLAPAIAGVFLLWAPQPLAAQDLATMGELTLNTKPPGAEVLINGRSVGVTPMTLSMLPGSIPITFKLKGFNPFEETVKLLAGDHKTLDKTLVPVGEEEPKPTIEGE